MTDVDRKLEHVMSLASQIRECDRILGLPCGDSHMEAMRSAITTCETSERRKRLMDRLLTCLAPRGE